VTVPSGAAPTGSAREDILAAIRSALRTGLAADTGQRAQPSGAPVPRRYRQAPADAGRADVLGLFTERLHNVGTTVNTVGSREVAEAVATALSGRGLHTVITPPGLNTDWLPDANFHWLGDEPALAYDDIAQADGVLTAAAVAIADSGTVVLDGGPGQGRRVLSLLPDAMCIVLRVDQVVRELPAALARLDGARPTTFISGPSATVDIEMVRVEGVHGPRRLDVILVR
jgi:L-lactate dehydrogenase complex protein LldG